MSPETILTYTIDGVAVTVESSSDASPSVGDDIVLSKAFDDMTMEQAWYDRGYTVVPLFKANEFAQIKQGLSRIVAAKLSDLGVDVKNFELEKYHRYVDDDIHYKIVRYTRELYPADFGISTEEIREKLGSILQQPMGYECPIRNTNQWLIIRINRPSSTDFNPVHKDIYELYDSYGKIPQMTNFWIPICGIEDKTGLPVAPASHLLNEKDILRYPAGSSIFGKPYRVNNIISWGGENALTTVVPSRGSVLVFTSHLIHGLGRNLNSDATRVSLEFRLFRNEQQ